MARRRVLPGAVLAGLLLCAAGAAQAESPLEHYLATRDRSITELNRAAKAGDDGTVLKAEDQAFRQLEAMLKDLIGPVAIRGFPREGHISLETLLEELGFGQLDGLAYAPPDGERRVVATTDGLFRAWLKASEARQHGVFAVPQDLREALRSDDVYTMAIGSDSRIDRFAELPVASATADDMFAMLAIHRQDIGPWMPDRIIVSLVRNGRVFVAVEPTSMPIEPIPECSAIWTRYEQANRDALRVYWGSKADEATRQALFKKAITLEGEGDDAHRRCFAEHVKEQGYYQAVVRQAQALVDALP